MKVEKRFKITKEESKIMGKKQIIFKANDIIIAYCSMYSEWFCTIKNGVPSNIRDKYKTAKETKWDYQGLKQLLNVDKIDSKIFKNSYPDLTWGNSGEILNVKKISEILENF